MLVAVLPLALVLFCGDEVVESTTHTQNMGYATLVLDGFLHLEVPSVAVPSLLELRRRLARVFHRMVERADGSGSGDDAHDLTDAVMELLRQPVEPEVPEQPNPSQNHGGGGSKKKKNRPNRR